MFLLLYGRHDCVPPKAGHKNLPACSRLSVSVGLLKKQADDERGLVEKEGGPLLFTLGSSSQLIPLVARSLFRSSSLTESLEQARHLHTKLYKVGGHTFSNNAQNEKQRRPDILARLFIDGGVRVCGEGVLRYFWCGFPVIFILTRGIAVSKH